MRYLIYARKSSESEDKQAQSIDDQLKELRALASGRNLEIVGEYTESHSAKDPGGRPVFAQVVARIQTGEADALLCWHVNRLFRNPVDFGTISWLLQTGTLQEIHTPHQTYRTGDNVLLLSVENGMANQYVIDLKKAVVRGLNSKVEKGWFPHKAPQGYLNREGTIQKDPQTFALVRKMWDMALSGGYTVPRIYAEVCAWGYTTRQGKRTGGTPLSRASLYNILTNIFYAGYFVRAGETHRGAHEPMVTLEEFFQVQKRLKGQSRRYRKHDFAFSGLIRCGRCGCAVVGEYKRKALADGTSRWYTYYSCSNAKKTCRRRVISEGAVEAQIAHLLDAVSLPQDFVEFGRRAIARWRAEEGAVREEIQAQQAQAVGEAERKVDRLLDMKVSGLLSDAEYLQQKKRLHGDVMRARMAQQVTHEQTDAQWENLENTLVLLHWGRPFFEGGEPAMQHLIADTLGAQYVLIDGRLAVELKPLFGKVAELKQTVDFGFESTKRDTSDPKCLTWWGLLEAMRTEVLVPGVRIINIAINMTPF